MSEYYPTPATTGRHEADLRAAYFGRGGLLSGAAAGEVLSDVVALTNTTPANTDETAWGTEEVTIPNPGREVTVQALLSGQASNFDRTNTNARIKVQVSLDGGATWLDNEYGNETWHAQTNVNAGAALDRWNLLATALHKATPTGDIKVRARCQSASAAGANFEYGGISVLVL